MHSSDAQIAPVFNLFRHGAEAGRLPHAYLVIGDPSGAALTFAEKICSYLVCSSDGERPCGVCPPCHRVAGQTHFDIFRIEPEKKSRIISVDAMRELMRKMRQTSFEGGWKVGIVLFADCLKEEAANAFLKTLEEPPPKTLLLLLTDSPQALLPTIRSRCQQLSLLGRQVKEQESWTEELNGIMSAPDLSSPLAQNILAQRINKVLAEEKNTILEEEKARQKQQRQEAQEKQAITTKEIEIFDARIEAKLKEVRQHIFRSFIVWQRDLLLLVTQCDPEAIFHKDKLDKLQQLADKLDIAAAMNRIRCAEEMVERINRLSRPETPLLESGLALMGQR